MKRVILESPYGSNDAVILVRNIRYACAAMRDCLLRNESPYASHLLYTQEGVLKDTVPDERELGIEAGFCWREAADYTVVYTDLGISDGMWKGIAHANRLVGHTIEYRWLYRGRQSLWMTTHVALFRGSA